MRPRLLGVIVRTIKRIIAAMEFTTVKFVAPWFFRRGAVEKSTPRNVLIVPMANAFGSLGDEAMLRASAQCMKKLGVQRTDLLLFSEDDNWDALLDFDTFCAPFRHYLGPKPMDWVRCARQLCRYDVVYALGADIMDGFHGTNTPLHIIRVLALASRMGIPAQLSGFSWNEKPDPVVVAAFKGLPSSVRCLCRDKLSQSRFVRDTGKSGLLTADVAFLFNRDEDRVLPDTKAMLEWIAAQQQNKHIVLGINLSCFVVADFAHEYHETFLAMFADLLIQLAARNPVSFALIPHDFRHYVLPSDTQLVADLGKWLSEKSIEIATYLPETGAADDIDAISEVLDGVVTGRMHFAIAALRNNVPVLCLPYQGKFEGTLAHFAIEGTIVSREKMVDRQAWLGMLEKFLSQIEKQSSCIASMRPKVQSLAKKNLDIIDGDAAQRLICQA